MAKVHSDASLFLSINLHRPPLQVGIDVSTAPRQAGYISDNSSITGISLMHDEGTGGNTNGGYGIFPLFPLMNCNFASCPVGLNARQALRARGTDGETFFM